MLGQIIGLFADHAQVIALDRADVTSLDQFSPNAGWLRRVRAPDPWLEENNIARIKPRLMSGKRLCAARIHNGSLPMYPLGHSGRKPMKDGAAILCLLGGV
jgi:hypothetical protein